MSGNSTPAPSSPAVSDRLRRQRRRETRIELEVRRRLFHQGLRYRIHRRLIPDVRREVDVVFPAARVAVDIRGCWWHGCPEHSTVSRSNSAWWSAKISANRGRDAETERLLIDAGWRVFVVWEHDDPAEAARWIGRYVRGALRAPSIGARRRSRPTRPSQHLGGVHPPDASLPAVCDTDRP